ncbi:1-aminocyclopropane-1-carboxylate deaminase/D-cysteine desulfhydrase [Paraferrimonas sedimenticola]|uniref:1-aminocyclopropane-1-carboxylate deaminase n=1 Tax=Paraferrimonas sedimenticola TaxID=375674 RepID=A0AA37RZ14_9GAMM|nr:pyridoxal-phosphate dependent enzyme [Paraferrimonas sedimenticola]GLP97397.1 1-aminocyclopropane-1-carboxylate deaminase [Paraferrimonas sedimenticola]
MSFISEFNHHSRGASVDRITHSVLNSHNVTLWLKRDDAIHQLISGNKWRKLKYQLVNSKNDGVKTLISFGGAFSNHLHALAAAGNTFGFNTIGVIRGEYDPNNPTLKQLQALGMKLEFVSRKEYRDRHDLNYQQSWQQRIPNSRVIAEGGSSELALPGVAESVDELSQQLGAFDALFCPVGSGGTVAGLVQGVVQAKLNTKVYGVCAVKDNSLEHKIQDLLKDVALIPDYQLISGYECGGFAKTSSEQFALIDDFYQTNQIGLDPVYTSKMMLAIFDWVRRGRLDGQTVVAIHTGGMQGWQGMSYLNQLPVGFTIPEYDICV